MLKANFLAILLVASGPALAVETDQNDILDWTYLPDQRTAILGVPETDYNIIHLSCAPGGIKVALTDVDGIAKSKMRKRTTLEVEFSNNVTEFDNVTLKGSIVSIPNEAEGAYNEFVTIVPTNHFFFTALGRGHSFKIIGSKAPERDLMGASNLPWKKLLKVCRR
ncbi:hypothetical protein [Mesorhizobium sp. KR2-14]|uniref:hypothetical protein n=1 Tax=Mesorhizobium sp. KR2-14 TaxID=3156610 RepID=UPI0032B606B2